MRIMINLDRVGGKFRIRCGYTTSSNDDVRIHNAGLDLYQQWKDVLSKCDDPRTLIVFEDERK